MKKVLLSLFLAMTTSITMNAKGIYEFSLGTELTLSEAAASETGFVLVADNQILGVASDGSAGLTMYDINSVAVAYMVKLEAIDGVTGTSATEPNAYHVIFYKPNDTKVEAGNRYGIWGNNSCTLTAVSWGSTWVAPNNADKADGRDFEYSARWNFDAQADGGFAVYFNEGTGKKYLNGASISDAMNKVWHLYPLTKKLVANTSYDFTKISFEEAKASTDPVIMVQNDMVLCNNNGGANYGSFNDFDEASCWVKFEANDEANNQYYITLNKDAETTVGYLNASVWSHVWVASSIDKTTTKGEKQDGAVFTINSLGDNQYSVQDLGGSEGSYDYSGNAYVTFCTNGYWTGNATWQNSDPSVWEFYKVTNPQTIYIENQKYTVSTTVGKIGTIVLDYPASITGATLYKTVSFDAATGLGLEEVEGDMVGGTPYIYLATADKIECTKTGESVAHDSSFNSTKSDVGNGLVGVYSDVTPSTWWFPYISSSYVISNNKIRQIGAGKVTIPANHCFFDASKMTQNSASSTKLILAPEENATAIKNVNTALGGGKIYDMNGREVKAMKKGGIYIVDGIKVNIK